MVEWENLLSHSAGVRLCFPVIKGTGGGGCCATYNKEAGARLAERNACLLALSTRFRSICFRFQLQQITLKRALAFIVFGKKVVQHPRTLAL